MTSPSLALGAKDRGGFGDPPVANLAITSGAFIAAACLSFLDPRLGLIACAAVVVTAAWRDPDLSLGLLVFSLPFDRVFHITEQPALMLLGLQIGVQLVSELWHRRIALAEISWRGRAWPVIAAYVVLAIFYPSAATDWPFRLKTAGFGLAALALLVVYDGRFSRRSGQTMVLGLLFGAAFQLAIDLGFRAGLRVLFLPPDSLPFDPVINGRLTGLTLNSNFLASILLAAFCFVLADLLFGSRRRVWPHVLLLGVFYSGVAQTVSKGPIIASVAMVLLLSGVLLVLGERGRARRAAIVAASCVALVLGNIVVPPLLPLAGPYAAEAYAKGATYVAKVYAEWTTPKSPQRVDSQAHVETPTPSFVPSPSSVLERKLRVYVESSTIELDARNKVVIGVDTQCKVICAGQRTRLWLAGWNIVREHWLTGFGFGGWRSHMQSLLGYPYSSPHSATLHLWGMFGVAGLVLNLALYGVILGRTRHLRLWLGSDPIQVWAVATTAYLILSMASEAVETSELLSLSRFGLFTWLMLALQGSACTSIRAAAAQSPNARPARAA